MIVINISMKAMWLTYIHINGVEAAGLMYGNPSKTDYVIRK
jgi:hypothetical protein